VPDCQRRGETPGVEAQRQKPFKGERPRWSPSGYRGRHRPPARSGHQAMDYDPDQFTSAVFALDRSNGSSQLHADLYRFLVPFAGAG
jgi:hypothetical protein